MLESPLTIQYAAAVDICLCFGSVGKSELQTMSCSAKHYTIVERHGKNERLALSSPSSHS